MSKEIFVCPAIEDRQDILSLDVYQMIYMLINTYCYDIQCDLYDKYCAKVMDCLCKIDGFAPDNFLYYRVYEEVTEFLNFYCDDCLHGFFRYFQDNPNLELSLIIRGDLNDNKGIF